jgi:hypothetical protein
MEFENELPSFLDFVEQEGLVNPEWQRFGFVLSFNQCNLECGVVLETLRDFTSVSSDFYPRSYFALLPGDRGMVFGPSARESTDDMDL